MITRSGAAALIPNGTCQSLTVTSGAVVKFSEFPPGTQAVRVSVKGASVNIRTDATNPTTTVGEQLDAGVTEVWPIEWIPLTGFIATSSNATVFGIPLKMP
jgi:hypothetical protein